MILSFKVLSRSAEMLGIEEEESKFEKWLKKRFGKSIMVIVMPISIILGVALAIGLFVLAPAAIVKGIEALFNVALEGWLKGIIEGVIKVALFISYLALVSLAPDIKRTFMYHGSEHKSIFCYEKGLELTVENVRMQKRFHPRCGTSFTFFMLGLGIIAGMVIPWEWATITIPFLNVLIRVLFKLLVLPLICGIGYEFLMYAGKHDHFLIRAISAPGLWLQRITTKEPDDQMIEVAIESLKGAMPEEFPEYADKPVEEQPQEKQPEVTEEKAEKYMTYFELKKYLVDKLFAICPNEAEREASIILEHSSGMDKGLIVAKYKEPVSEKVECDTKELLNIRLKRVPLAYVTGKTGFMGFTL